jgi:hypothetical protein
MLVLALWAWSGDDCYCSVSRRDGGNRSAMVLAQVNTLSLDGELGSVLVAGGAYDRFEGPAREAKNLGAQIL